jgi:hypothetical protein
MKIFDTKKNNGFFSPQKYSILYLYTGTGTGTVQCTVPVSVADPDPVWEYGRIRDKASRIRNTGASTYYKILYGKRSWSQNFRQDGVGGA